MAITYGMSVKEFWEDSPDLFWAYRFSYYKKKLEEQEIFNHNAWLQGMYICESIHVALCNCFGNKKMEYSKKPYSSTSNNLEEERLNEQELLVAKIKNRVLQVQAIKGKEESSTTKTRDS